MKTWFLLVLTVVGLVVSSAFAGEVLINQETGQVRVEETNLWRPANAFEVEAYENPKTEVLVWSSIQWTATNFFFAKSVKMATNVVVYDNGKINSLTKEITENGETRFLWFKFYLTIGILAMAGSTVAPIKAKVNLVFLAAASAALATPFALIAGITTPAFVVNTAIALSAVSTFVAGFAGAFILYKPTVREKVLYWIFSGVFCILALVALCT